MVAPATPQFYLQDQSLSTESSRTEKPPACFSVLGVAGSSSAGPVTPTLANGFPNWNENVETLQLSYIWSYTMGSISFRHIHEFWIFEVLLHNADLVHPVLCSVQIEKI